MASMTSTVTTSLLLFVAFTFFCYQAKGAVVNRPGPCPAGRKNGDDWLLPDCKGQCFCIDNSVTCYTCFKIYMDYEKSSCHELPGNGVYPNCCIPRVVCRGEKGFDETKLTAATARS